MMMRHTGLESKDMCQKRKLKLIVTKLYLFWMIILKPWIVQPTINSGKLCGKENKCSQQSKTLIKAFGGAKKMITAKKLHNKPPWPNSKNHTNAEAHANRCRTRKFKTHTKWGCTKLRSYCSCGLFAYSNWGTFIFYLTMLFWQIA